MGTHEGGASQPHGARPRLVALGASNLARGMLALLDAARAAHSGPVEAFAALGRGRSYGIRSSLLGRGLGGIDDCGLWPALAASARAPTTAIVMDVGNDLLYGVEVDQLLTWVAAAVQRLRTADARTIVVGLPMTTLRRLGERRYRLVRSILFSRCRLTRTEMLDRAERTHRGLAALARAHGAAFHELPAHGYGFDAIHFRHRVWPAVARAWLGLEGTATTPPLACNGAWARLRFLGAAPAVSTWWGRERRAAQPVRHWADGTTLALY